jgi:hypothetical protein
MPDSHGQIQSEIKEKMQCWGEVLDETFNGKDYKTKEPKWGFALLVFQLGEDDDDGTHRMNYISNARRRDMIKAMKEFIARDALNN